MGDLDLVRLPQLMARGAGQAEVVVGLVDGPVALRHPDFAGSLLRILGDSDAAGCGNGGSAACRHGTFVAGLLSARRLGPVPGICPGCTLLIRPVLGPVAGGIGDGAGARPEDLAEALVNVVEAGARVVNLSLTLSGRADDDRDVADAMDRAADRGALVVVAAGNDGALATSVIARHPCAIPVAAYGRAGRPMHTSNMGLTIGVRGLGAPGEAVRSLGADGGLATRTGTSAAAPYVSGAVALLWSAFPSASAAEIRYALAQSRPPGRRSVVPPLLDAWAAYLALRHARHGYGGHSSMVSR